MTNYSYEDVDRAERDRERRALSMELDGLRHKRSAIVDEIEEIAQCVLDSDPGEVVRLSGELTKHATSLVALAHLQNYLLVQLQGMER